MADDGHQIAMAARFRPETQKPFSALWKVTRSTRPASTSWVDVSRLDLIRIAGSSVLSLCATSGEPPRRRNHNGADGARCRVRTNAIDGRKPDIADRGRGRRNWADSGHFNRREATAKCVPVADIRWGETGVARPVTRISPCSLRRHSARNLGDEKVACQRVDPRGVWRNYRSIEQRPA